MTRTMEDNAARDVMRGNDPTPSPFLDVWSRGRPSPCHAGRHGRIGSHTIRKITPAGVVGTLAGQAGSSGIADGPGTEARFDQPAELAIDANGNIFVNDTGNKAIRKVTPQGVVSTVASSPAVDSRWSAATGGYSYYIDRYSGLAFTIHDLAVDAGGNLLVSDTGTVANTPPGGGPASYSALRKISSDGTLTTLPAPADGLAAPFGQIAVNQNGEIIVATASTIQKVPADGTVTLLAGSPDSGDTGEFFATGPALAARFMWPQGLALDTSGNIFLTDNNNIVRELSVAGEVSTVAGIPKPLAEQTLDGTGEAARLHRPIGLAVDAMGNVYAADLLGRTIRKITPGGVVTTLAGPTKPDGSALFRSLECIAIDPAGNIYVTDPTDQTISKLTSQGELSVFAGSSRQSGHVDGARADARFSGPYGIAADTSGNLYVSDIGNSVIRKITPGGTVSTFAGVPKTAGYQDGLAGTALFKNPEGIAVDLSGNVYVAESASHTIRKITPSGTVSTLAGRPAATGFDDGPAETATFGSVSAVAVDADGNVFVADSSSSAIRKITPAGEVSTIGGRPDFPGSADGTGRDARFYYPGGLAVDRNGALYVSSASTVRKAVQLSGPVISVQPQSQSVAAGASVTFAVTASASPAPTYQWYFNGNPVSGAGANSLTVSNAQPASVGDYTVVVTNSVSSVTSNKATLSLQNPSPAPAPQTPPAGGDNGGGSLTSWFALTLFVLGAARKKVRRMGSVT